MNLTKKLIYILLFCFNLSGISQNLVVNNVFLNQTDNIIIKIDDLRLRNSANCNFEGKIYFEGDWLANDSTSFCFGNNAKVYINGKKQQNILSKNNKFADIVLQNSSDSTKAILLLDNFHIDNSAELRFINGIVYTDTSKFIFENNSHYLGLSDSSFIDGRIQYKGDSLFVYPCGDIVQRNIGNGLNEYIMLSPIEFFTADTNTVIEYLYRTNSLCNNTSLYDCIDSISKMEYWKIDCDSAITNLKVYYNDNMHAVNNVCSHGFCNSNPVNFAPYKISIAAYQNQWERFSSINIGSHNSGSFSTDSIIFAPQYISYSFIGDSFSDTINFDLCSPSLYTLANGQSLMINSDTTVITNVYTNIGCDSIITENIRLHQEYNDIEDVILCYGDNYQYPDQSVVNNLINSTSHTSCLNTINGCDSIITTNISIDNVMASVNVIKNVKCFGDSDGKAEVIINSGIPPYTYLWNTNPAQFANIADSLVAGVYTVIISDSINCRDTALIEIQQNDRIIASIDLLNEKTICKGETESLNNTVIGGSPPYTYNWWCNTSNCNIDLSNLINPLASPISNTIYYLQIEDSNQCLSDIDSVVVNVSDLLLDAGADIYFNEGEVLYLNALANENNVVWTWQPQQYLDSYIIGDPIATPLNDITYYIEIQNQFYCLARDTLKLFMEERVIPNTITPNGDGKNDVWIIDKLEFYPKAIVEIYNRWGNRLFISDPGYPIPWDATYKNEKLPTGAYYYVIDLGELGKEKLQGAINVIRED